MSEGLTSMPWAIRVAHAVEWEDGTGSRDDAWPLACALCPSPTPSLGHRKRRKRLDVEMTLTAWRKVQLATCQS
ncbi:hypothetical protein GGTG_02533 [Gaeumannomyces tritici R3-111a-1]|uniref:Uncharacterized protein n=1 Tax=Gaeumannomyces tritici (strain R3-111a-1) TaxID=644352 RepID=J3NMM7_GAET3|nr:hypothetical protein GGTG_02533 [Gaeumannomyces tritici R3-111a-1]EJT82560.1 hypothetical protein GGTG_02533 [Gaeumannomyces tritici R3-111a-1]